MESKIGVVFGGGGGKGAYQIGVWKALNEFGLCGLIKGVSGASAGALNGAMFCAGDLDMAVSAWRGISERAILTRDICQNYRGGVIRDGWFSNRGLKEMIKRYADLTAVRNSKTVFYAAASRVREPAIFYNYLKKYSSEKNILHKAISAFFITKLSLVTTARYFKVNGYDERTIEDIILASSAIPLVFPDITIEGSVYVDGGLKDNVPVLPLYNDGFRRILVANLDAGYRIPAAKFPGAEFFELTLNEGDRLRTMAGTFDFTAKHAEARMERGYNDCLAAAESVLEFFKM